MTHKISSEQLTIERLKEIIFNDFSIELSNESKERIIKCRTYLDEKIKNSSEPIYGVSTGFGSLYNVSINQEQLTDLQRNLVISHACGLGDEVPLPIVKLMLLLKIQSLSYGYSGAQLCTVQRLIDMYNNNVLPVVYQNGSLGASGDLAPLAHLSLPLLNLGEVYFNSNKLSPFDDTKEFVKFSADKINQEFNWDTIKLQSKEGLALLNGTQFMSAYAVWNIIKSEQLSELADEIMSVSLEAYDGRIEAFNESVHLVRPHNGQLRTARNIRKYLLGSEIIKQKKTHVQDPYSFRCVPQVHGSTKDTIAYVKSVITTEINSATDNPTVLPDENLIISAGNFHGQPLALVMDFLSIAMSELANISERRIYQLISGKRGLPNFLVENPGLNSGFMIPQYTAASIVSQSKMLCMPNSVDSIESSQGQEDHVSMGANSATKCYKVIENTEKVLAIELFNAAQAFDFRCKKFNIRSSEVLQNFVADFRKVVNYITDDELMYLKIHNAVKFLQKYKINN